MIHDAEVKSKRSQSGTCCTKSAASFTVPRLSIGPGDASIGSTKSNSEIRYRNIADIVKPRKGLICHAPKEVPIRLRKRADRSMVLLETDPVARRGSVCHIDEQLSTRSRNCSPVPIERLSRDLGLHRIGPSTASNTERSEQCDRLH